MLGILTINSIQDLKLLYICSGIQSSNSELMMPSGTTELLFAIILLKVAIFLCVDN